MLTRILLVDDRGDRLLALESVLEGISDEVATLRSGEKALEYLRDHEVAVILLDVRMPTMDGFEAARRIREAGIATPIIFVTAASSDEVDLAQGYAHGAVDFLFNATVPTFLRSKVSVFVELYRRSNELKRERAHLERTVEERTRSLVEAHAGERAAREEAEKIGRAKDEFLAILSHELRTPLQSILGWANVLRAKTPSVEEMHEGLEIIERNAHAQKRIIEDLLDYTRIASGRVGLDIQTIDLASVVEVALETVRPAAEARGIRLEPVIDPGVRAVRGDPHRLQQVVWNLLSNAIKFTGRGGRVEVALSRVDSQVKIEVSDTGSGIKPEFLPYVFERFRQADPSTTRKQSGLGIGLAIVKQLVELHGGSVRVESPGEGRGSTFTVALPFAVKAVEGPFPVRAQPQTTRSRGSMGVLPDLHGLKILVVDDEPDTRELIGRVFQERGADVLRAPSAAEALEVLSAHRPDVLVSDIGMPNGDGYDLIRKVRELPPEKGGLTLIATKLNPCPL